MCTNTLHFSAFCISCLFCLIDVADSAPAKKFVQTTSVGSSFCRPPEGEEVGQVKARSRSDCLRQCSSADSCVSAAFSTSQRTCLFYDIAWGQDRCQPVEDWVMLNGRAVCSNNTHCTCVCGYVGSHCQRLMEDCLDAHRSGYYPKLAKVLYQDVLRAKPKMAPYDMTLKCVKGGYSTITRHNQKTPGDFNRTWAEYELGFGHPNKFTFMGLQPLYYLLASRSYNLVMYGVYGNYFKLTYANFTLLENVTYTASIGEFTGPSSDQLDLLHDINGRRFSTFDDYSDPEAGDCALERGCGWWYGSNDCGNYSVFGRIGSSGDGIEDFRYAFWGKHRPGSLIHITAYLIRQE